MRCSSVGGGDRKGRTRCESSSRAPRAPWDPGWCRCSWPRATRSSARRAAPSVSAPSRLRGRSGVVMDGLDAASVRTAVLDATTRRDRARAHRTRRRGARPQALRRGVRGHQRAAHPGDRPPARRRPRGRRRSAFIAQSFTGWPNERTGGRVKTEEDPLDPTPTAASSETVAAIRHVEQATTDAGGLALRYGGLYGPGNSSARAANCSPWCRTGSCRSSATGRACGRSATSTTRHPPPPSPSSAARRASTTSSTTTRLRSRNGCPNSPRIIGAKPPRHVPALVARPLIGEHGVSLMTKVRGSSNAKAKRELGWEPRYPSWREGFRTGLG